MSATVRSALIAMLLSLAGEACVMVECLAEDGGLMSLLASGGTYDEALDYINENY